MDGTTIDGFHGMNPDYFMGYMAKDAPTNRLEAPAIAASDSESQQVTHDTMFC